MRLGYILGLFMVITLSHAKLIFLIRNGEKLSNKVSSLSPVGEARAKCLVELFGNNGTFITPQKIYAKKSEKKNTRPFDTASPLAQNLQLTIDDSYDNDDTEKLSKNIMKSPEEVVLVVWTNGDIDDIPYDFGVKKPLWDDKIYDEIWVLTNNSPQSYTKQPNTVNEITEYNGNADYRMVVVKQDIVQCIKNIVPEYSQLNSGSSIIKANLITILVGIFLTVLFLY